MKLIDHDEDLRTAFKEGVWLGVILGLVGGAVGFWALAEAIASVGAR